VLANLKVAFRGFDFYEISVALTGKQISNNFVAREKVRPNTTCSFGKRIR